MIPGDTIFAGDSITVGYAPKFVKVDGRSFRLAYGGLDSAWILKQMKSADATGQVDLANPVLKEPLGSKITPLNLSSYKNLVLLIGTNDMGGWRAPDAIFTNILATWQIAKKHGLKVIACTVPPFNGWATYQPSWDVKRDAVNRMIASSEVPDGLIFLDFYLKDAVDPNKLAKEWDSGDHLHPRPDKLGPLIQAEVEGILSAPILVTPSHPDLRPGQAPPPQLVPTPQPGATQPESSPLVGVLSIAAGCGILYSLWKTYH